MSGQEHEKQTRPDTTSDPLLADRQQERADEGASSDWSSEGGATREGPATHAGAAADDDERP